MFYYSLKKAKQNERFTGSLLFNCQVICNFSTKEEIKSVLEKQLQPDGTRKVFLSANTKDLIKHHQAKASFRMQIMDLNFRTLKYTNYQF